MLPSRHDLYERCVQRPAALVPLLAALHGQSPRILAEDFCGTAALSREWLRAIPSSTAFATDHDREMIAAARERCESSHLHLIHANVLEAAHERADIIFVGNYSIGELHDRTTLLRYLSDTRSRLRSNAIFVCDTYGGEAAFRVGAIQRLIPHDDNSRIRYTWEHRQANAFTGMVTNAIHFRIERDANIIYELTDAFTYHWRLWSVPELTDALLEAGFARVEVREDLDPTHTSHVPSENFAVTLCARLS